MGEEGRRGGRRVDGEERENCGWGGKGRRGGRVVGEESREDELGKKKDLEVRGIRTLCITGVWRGRNRKEDSS